MDISKEEYDAYIEKLRNKYRNKFQAEKKIMAYAKFGDKIEFQWPYVEWLENAVFEAYEPMPN